MYRKAGIVLVCATGLAVAGALGDGHGGASDSHGTKQADAPKAKAPTKKAPKPKAAEPEEAPPAPARNATQVVPGKPVSADEALVLLQEGNERWVSGKVIDPNVDTGRRQATADNGQTPFVTVLTCADSRIPVERVFDRGVGDVFVVRVAGNVAGASETGTIEYGTGHLNTKLLVVMGHTKCGAVAAAATGAELHGKVSELVASIQPAVDRARRNNPGVDDKQLANLAVRENVWQSCFGLISNSPEIRGLVEKGDLKVVGAIYDIATGKVEFLGEHPWQRELLGAARAGQPASAPAQAPHAQEAQADEHSGH